MLLNRLIKWRVDVVFTKDITVPCPVAVPDRLVLTPIGPEHRQVLDDFVHKHHADVANSLAMIEECYRGHYHGFLAQLGGEVVGYRWWADHGQKHPHLALYGLTLQPGDFYSFGLYIARAFRNHGLALEVMEKMRRELAAQGHKRSYSVVKRENMPSQRLRIKFGEVKIQQLTVLTLFSCFLLCRGQLHRRNPLSL